MAAANSRSRHLDPLWEGRVLVCTVGACLSLLAALLLFFPPKPLQQAHLRLYDAMLADRTMQVQTSVPVLVGLDEESLTAYGQWPWPRYRLAMLVERLQKLGAEVVALDFLMPEPDRSSPEVIEFERRRDLGQRGARASPSGGDSNSDRLSEVIGRGTVVLGSYFDFAGVHETPGYLASPASQTGMAFVSTPGSTDGWPKAKVLIRSLPTLTTAASAEGFTNSIRDVDGTLRRVPLMLVHDKRVHPSFSFAALLLAAKDRTVSVVKDGAEVSVHWRHMQIPVDSAGNLLLDFRSGKPAFPYYSAKAILEGELSPGKLEGKIVLVGAWATGLGDSHLTPSGSQMHGLEAHATVIDNILASTFISQPGWGKGAELLAVVTLGVIGTLLLSQAGYVVSLVAVTLLTTACYSAARFMLVGHGIYISPLLPMLTLITITSVLGMLKYGIEARKVQHRTLELIDAQDTVITSMSALTETRDRDTGGHILRTQRYVEILARQLCQLEKYADLDEMSILLLKKSAPLHDIGKIGIPDSILQKPERLTAAEFEIIKSHTLIGADALARIRNDTGHRGQHDFLNYARQMAISHHEWWDGSGYPYGLKGEEIPFAGRLMALADVYDALISHRSYKTSLPHEHAREHIRQQSGGQFDPDVVDAFMARNEEFYATSQSISDGRSPKMETSSLLVGERSTSRSATGFQDAL